MKALYSANQIAVRLSRTAPEIELLANRLGIAPDVVLFDAEAIEKLAEHLRKETDSPGYTSPSEPMH